MYGTLWWDSPFYPTLGLLCKSQVCSVGVSFWVCSITMFSWCSPHVFLASYAPCSLSQPKIVSDKNTQRCILTWQHVLAFIEKEGLGFYDNHNFFIIIQGNSQQCLIYGFKLDHGNLATNNGGIVPSFTTKHLALMFKLQG